MPSWLQTVRKSSARRLRVAGPRFLPALERLEDRRVLNSSPVAPANEQYVAELFQDLLDRPPDPQGAAYFCDLLNQGQVTRPQLATGILESEEYRTHVVQDLYEAHLGRPAEGTGLAYWVQVQASGASPEQLEAGLLGSQEYAENRGGGTANGFLHAVYGAVLHRVPDPAGTAGWSQAMTAGMPREAVAAAVLASPEADQLQVKEVYDEFLERPADAGGLAGFTGALRAGLPDNQVVAQVVGSDEYFQTATAPAAGLPERFASEADLEHYLIDNAVARWQGVFGTSWQPYRLYGTPALDGLPAGAPIAAAAAVSFSNTNVQVQGVDEADRVKTDGEYLYLLSDRDLVIVDVRQPAQPQVVSRTPFEGVPFALYLNEDRLTVLSNRYDFQFWAVDTVLTTANLLPDRSPSYVDVTVLDVSNPAAVEQAQRTELEGYYVDSRLIDNQVYVVVQNDLHTIAYPRVIAEGDAYRYETEAEYRARVTAEVGVDGLPGFQTFHNTQVVDAGAVSQPTDIFRPIDPGDDNLLSVVVFDVTADTGPVDSVSVMAPYATTVYASLENLYLVAPHWSPGGAGTSTIYQFDLEGTDVEFVATGSVPGQVLNQFSLDEHDGHLRIATTTSLPGVGPSNNLYVLGRDGSALEIVGRIVDLAPGERIFASRFLGDEGFLVTFRQVDPFFTLDLSLATAPRVAGELKEAGFSRYLHPAGAGLVIGLGRDADPLTGRAQALKVSAYDTDPLSDPTLLHRRLIAADAGHAFSSAEFDHHAINFYEDLGVLVFSVDTYDFGADNGSSVPAFGSAAYVLHLDAPTGIELLGTVPHETHVDRTVRIADLLFSISADTVKVNPILDPGTLVGQLRFREPPAPPGGPVPPIVIF